MLTLRRINGAKNRIGKKVLYPTLRLTHSNFKGRGAGKLRTGRHSRMGDFPDVRAFFRAESPNRPSIIDWGTAGKLSW